MYLFLDLVVTISVMTLVALGLAIILGLMNVINLAHAGLMAVGVYGVIALQREGFGFWSAVALSTAFSAVLGAVMEWLVIRRLYGRTLDDTILATWGLSLILVQSVSLIFGRSTLAIDVPVPGGVEVLGVPYSAYRLLLVVFTVALVLAMGATMRFTQLGLKVRMVMSNEPLARGIGINTNRVRQVTFIVGAALSALAGALLGPTQGITPNYGSGLLAPAFLAVLMSGKTLPGVLIACAILGVTQAAVTVFLNPVIASVMVVVVAVVILRIKPEGLVWQKS